MESICHIRPIWDPLLTPQAEYVAGSEKPDSRGDHPCYPFDQPRPGRAATAEDPTFLITQLAWGAGCNRRELPHFA